MLQLIYTSTAVGDCTTDTLGHLLIQSRARNVNLEITGMLLYDYGRFLQVLEGPDEQVVALFASILCDPRHTEIVMLSRNQIQIREFQYWSMAFLDLSTVSPSTASPPLKVSELITSTDCAVKAKKYLRDFQGELYYQLAFRDQCKTLLG